MTAQERDQLQQFLAALRQQRSHPKDTLAEGLIRDALAQQPDAPYWLVQRSMALQLALNATQDRLAQLQAQCDEQAARWQALASDASPTVAQANKPADGGAQVVPLTQSQPSPWGRGLLAQVSGTALGVSAGVVAGGLLLQGLDGLFGPAAAPSGVAQGSASNLSSTDPDAGDGLWDLGDDWA
ncbi:DUF2076 family protein [Limnohabitans sp. 63ED37-2]|uniref:DUF2076 family protein n=1 Tax=Limnohabitans sp. 63ED37-2 TaxID=1678128 RepID=UPI00070681A3|nr:DUF2076 family protein [Limnohabitans sp. 63ED37-2]ALK90115.1 hypothetical protein L63ED372_02917 [Limnohabitans sp. 63ED37-2]